MCMLNFSKVDDTARTPSDGGEPELQNIFINFAVASYTEGLCKEAFQPRAESSSEWTARMAKLLVAPLVIFQ